jgi:hypothetical protein
MLIPIIAITTLVGISPYAVTDKALSLAPPVLLHVAGRPIDVAGSGHSAPFVADVDGDGLDDLLVGQYDDGKLRIYRNVGTKTEPAFGGFTWFKDDAPTGRVPFG